MRPFNFYKRSLAQKGKKERKECAEKSACLKKQEKASKNAQSCLYSAHSTGKSTISSTPLGGSITISF
jgi:hypothetical protein